MPQTKLEKVAFLKSDTACRTDCSDEIWCDTLCLISFTLSDVSSVSKISITLNRLSILNIIFSNQKRYMKHDTPGQELWKGSWIKVMKYFKMPVRHHRHPRTIENL